VALSAHESLVGTITLDLKLALAGVSLRVEDCEHLSRFRLMSLPQLRRA
jgi:hypothetical protein